MRRRDFIKLSSAAGVAGVVGSHFDTAAANPMYAQAGGFDLHPFIKRNPGAVFVYHTDIKQKTDQKDINDAAYKLAREMFVSTSGGAGYPNSTKIAGKPNWTCAPQDSEDPTGSMGIITDLGFTEGYFNGIKSKGPQNIYLRECACPPQWEPLGMRALADRNNFDLKNLVAMDPWEYGDDIIFKEVNGVVFKEIGFQAPMAAPNSFMVNIAKFKTHRKGVTGTVKNLQGIAARRFHQFCSTSDPFRSLDVGYHKYYQPNHVEKIAELHKQHVEMGIPRWNERMARPPGNAGLRQEYWVQRMLDAYSVIPISQGIHILEGVYWRDGDGFAAGPWNGKPKDYMCNMTLFGMDPFRIDLVAHWLAGHEPGNFGLFHIGIERGFANLLDPFDVPIFTWNNGRARRTRLNRLTRTPLLMEYNQKEGEDMYIMVDEPFDYKHWKKTGKIATIEPSIQAIGTDTNNNIVMEMSVPEKGDVYVDILNNQGELVWRMRANDLEPGNHQVVWDGFASPGVYNTYVKGMSWDAESQMVIYT